MNSRVHMPLIASIAREALRPRAHHEVVRPHDGAVHAQSRASPFLIPDDGRTDRGRLCLNLPAATPGTAAATSPSQTPKAMSSAPYIFPGNDGKAHKVAWDKHSFTIDGTRLSIWFGELHYWRLPSQQAWRDVMRKARANGFNAISLYFFWGLHQESADGKFDFSGIKDIDKLLTIAEEEGLYVIARPGPYINAEISMGGLPATMSNQPGPLRGTANLARSKQWLHAFDVIARKHQVTTGGGSLLMYQVENELLDESSDRSAFLKALTSYVRADGITVPLFTNDYSMAGHRPPLTVIQTRSGTPAGRHPLRPIRIP